tara:strand:- start:40 stop:408 length:369 start_codon:yes stop_codon:yes gene_type:complete
MIKSIRYILGQIIIFLDWLTRPKRPNHSIDVQKILDLQTENFTLYQMHRCPFCVKTRRAIHCLGLNIKTKDVKRNPNDKEDLIRFGGHYKVPCLAIEENGITKWMYESNDIIEYLQQRFSQS